MPLPATALKIIQVTGAVYTTYKLARDAIEALSSAPNADHLDTSGNQTARGEVWRPNLSVGILDLRWSIQAQTIPDAPRGQFLTEFTVVLHREEAQGVGAKLPVTIELLPSWYSAEADTPGEVLLTAGTFDVELPIGSHAVKGFVTVDGSQAFSAGSAPQTFHLRARILTPNQFELWTARILPPDKPAFRREQHTQDGLAVDFDYWHLPWE